MITHNGKQVTLAMRNRKAINLIARNGKAMFGELSDVNTGISFAAKAVILAEYGLEVWNDTRAYAKAHPAIAPFINQDPHLACSISTNSNKERILDTNGAINTPLGVKTSSKTTLKITMEFTSYTGNVHIGYHPGNDSQDWRLFCTSGTMYFDCGSARISQGFALNRKAEIECGVTYITVDGTKKTAATSDTIAEGEIVLCKDGGSFKSYGNFEIFDGEQWNVFAPMIDKDGVGCVLNLTKCTTHYPSSGQFTIAITDKE